MRAFARIIGVAVALIAALILVTPAMAAPNVSVGVAKERQGPYVAATTTAIGNIAINDENACT